MSGEPPPYFNLLVADVLIHIFLYSQNVIYTSYNMIYMVI